MDPLCDAGPLAEHPRRRLRWNERDERSIDVPHEPRPRRRAGRGGQADREITGFSQFNLVGNEFFQPVHDERSVGPGPRVSAAGVSIHIDVRIGDAVASRNIHAAIYDALRLVKDV